MIRYWEENVEAKIAIPFDIKEHDKELLDKIRAEIKQLPTTTCTETYRMQINTYDFKENVIAIIDKYKAESEG